MNEHKDTCLYAPSICPVPDCNYEGFTGWWSRHFLREHRSSAKRFGYEQSFQLYLKRYEPFLALLGQDGHLFLLNNCADTMGNCLSIVCLRPGNLKWKFYYDLMAFGRESSVQLKASVMNFKDWKDFDNNKYAFLLIPNNFLYSDVMPLTILIRKITSYDV
ncbi:E3 ubiquitin-protein ligase SINA-like 4 [Typha latifolia]|uniref:E3 ubiquitin-protein ligase SINA-like 4 n=1 Tax=Typha latifolia TaxID=4733 RepID=UPI003C2D2FC6